jgi:hypothetical protein
MFQERSLRKEIVMDWLSQNWLWIFIFIAFIAMHLFGHGGHGGHSRQQERPEAGKEGKKDGGRQQHQHY